MQFAKRHFSMFCYVLLMLLTAVVDASLGIYISLWIVYLIPIGLATWNLGAKPGICLTGIALLLLSASAFIWGHPYLSVRHLGFVYASQAIVYLVLVFLVAALRRKEVERVFVPTQN